MRRVQVVHQYTLEHDVPDDWDDDMVEFFFNESSHCADNEAKVILDGLRHSDGFCLCSKHSARVVKNA